VDQLTRMFYHREILVLLLFWHNGAALKNVLIGNERYLISAQNDSPLFNNSLEFFYIYIFNFRGVAYDYFLRTCGMIYNLDDMVHLPGCVLDSGNGEINYTFCYDAE
jgi:hypothetical protein